MPLLVRPVEAADELRWRDLRAGGVGRALIDWLRAEVRSRGWSSLYWQTKETNYRARALYDTYIAHSGFLRYVLRNPG